jgi:hypothetical protein
MENKKLEEVGAKIPQEVKDQVDETVQALDRAYYLGAEDFAKYLEENYDSTWWVEAALVNFKNRQKDIIT